MSTIMLMSEAVRQEVEIEILTETLLIPDVVILDETCPDRCDPLAVRDRIGRMKDALVRLDVGRFSASRSDLLRMMTDDMYADWNLVRTTHARLSNRLRDRIRARALRGATGPPSEARRRIARISGGLVDLVALDLATIPVVVGHSPDCRRGSWAWSSRHRLLPDSTGPEDERRAYEEGDFSPDERAVLDRWFASRLPAFGMYYTLAAVASDIYDRYAASPRNGMGVAADDAADVLDLGAFTVGD